MLYKSVDNGVYLSLNRAQFSGWRLRLQISSVKFRTTILLLLSKIDLGDFLSVTARLHHTICQMHKIPLFVKCTKFPCRRQYSFCTPSFAFFNHSKIPVNGHKRMSGNGVE